MVAAGTDQHMLDLHRLRPALNHGYDVLATYIASFRAVHMMQIDLALHRGAELDFTQPIGCGCPL